MVQEGDKQAWARWCQPYTCEGKNRYVSVHSACYNDISQTGWLINNECLLGTVLGARNPRSGCQPGQVLVRALFQVTDLSLYLVWHRGLEALWDLFYKSTDFSHED